jgi:hypothetical protein
VSKTEEHRQRVAGYQESLRVFAFGYSPFKDLPWKARTDDGETEYRRLKGDPTEVRLPVEHLRTVLELRHDYVTVVAGNKGETRYCKFSFFDWDELMFDEQPPGYTTE